MASVSSNAIQGDSGIIPLPHYAPTFAKYRDTNINEDNNCPAMYNGCWSDALIDIINNHCRQHNILKELDQEIPKVIFQTIAMFYSNDMTHDRSYNDYVDALLICKYFSKLKETSKSDLNENDVAIKIKYKLKKTSALTTKKIMSALKDYKKKSFEINNGVKMEDFEILFIDHHLNKYNLKKYSYPNDIQYTISNDELRIIAAICDTIDLNRKYPVCIRGHIQEYHRSNELIDILHKMYFRTGKTSIRIHTIVTYQDKALFAIDYDNTFAYFMFVFKFFTIIIHDKMEGERHTTRTMKAKAIASKYRGILEQFDKSGL